MTEGQYARLLRFWQEPPPPAFFCVYGVKLAIIPVRRQRQFLRFNYSTNSAANPSSRLP